MVCWNEDKIPQKYEFLDPNHLIQRPKPGMRFDCVIATDAASFDYLNQSASPTTTATTPLTTVSATGTGTQEPSPTNLTRMTADGIPCVK